MGKHLGFAAVSLLTIVVAGCGESDASCAKAVAHAMDVVNHDKTSGWADRSDAEKKERADQLAGWCKDGWSAAQRNCMMKAKATDDLQTCGKPTRNEGLRKHKPSEAELNLRKIYDGARSYYEEHAQFPGPELGPTPALGTCCAAAGRKCAPDPSLWTGGWEALRFSVDDTHSYSYRFQSSGTGASASFTASAFGDLDCDGDYSTFEVTGTIGADGTLPAMSLRKEKELE